MVLGGNYLTISDKDTQIPTLWSNNFGYLLLDIYLREMKHKHMLTKRLIKQCTHSLTHNSQKLEQ